MHVRIKLANKIWILISIIQCVCWRLKKKIIKKKQQLTFQHGDHWEIHQQLMMLILKNQGEAKNKKENEAHRIGEI